MSDYTLAVGEEAPYGFSATSSEAALRHALDYCLARLPTAADPPLALMGPDGLLTGTADRLSDVRGRVPLHWPERADDVRPADPTPPDCNGA